MVPSVSGALPAGELFVDVQIDSEEHERPEKDREDCRQHAAPPIHVLEVVVRRRDRNANADVYKGYQADSATASHASPVPRP